jgi:hypothetical protein
MRAQIHALEVAVRTTDAAAAGLLGVAASRCVPIPAIGGGIAERLPALQPSISKTETQ